ncbi:MAG: hypothetical protein EZS28_029244, partial [Streblomastix strix]
LEALEENGVIDDGNTTELFYYQDQIDGQDEQEGVFYWDQIYEDGVVVADIGNEEKQKQ